MDPLRCYLCGAEAARRTPPDDRWPAALLGICDMCLDEAAAGTSPRDVVIAWTFGRLPLEMPHWSAVYEVFPDGLGFDLLRSSIVQWLWRNSPPWSMTRDELEGMWPMPVGIEALKEWVRTFLETTFVGLDGKPLDPQPEPLPLHLEDIYDVPEDFPPQAYLGFVVSHETEQGTVTLFGLVEWLDAPDDIDAPDYDMWAFTEPLVRSVLWPGDGSAVRRMDSESASLVEWYYRVLLGKRYARKRGRPPGSAPPLKAFRPHYSALVKAAALRTRKDPVDLSAVDLELQTRLAQEENIEAGQELVPVVPDSTISGWWHDGHLPLPGT